MKKILFFLISAFAVSCTSPYYPEYVPVVSLGTTTDALICENGEGTARLSILSNVPYTATLRTGSDWLSFSDTDEPFRSGTGSEVVEFVHRANNHDKRVAELVLTAEGVERVVKIKQKGCFDDFIEFAPDTKEILTEEDNTRMLCTKEQRDVELRLRTSCLDHEISCRCDYANAISSFEIKNSVLRFTLNENNEGQPRIIDVTISYVDGWGDTQSLHFSIKQTHHAAEND